MRGMVEGRSSAGQRPLWDRPSTASGPPPRLPPGRTAQLTENFSSLIASEFTTAPPTRRVA